MTPDTRADTVGKPDLDESVSVWVVIGLTVKGSVPVVVGALPM